MFVFWLCVLSKLSYNVDAFSIEALHDYMTESELGYYFQNSDRFQIPKYEIVYLPTLIHVREADRYDMDESEEETIDYNFSVFKRPLELKLKRNKNLLSPNFKTYIRNGDNGEEILDSYTKICHYIHEDDRSVAAISICQPQSIQGIVVFDNETLEIHPLTDRLQRLVQLREPLLSSIDKLDLDERIPHLVKKAAIFPTGNIDDILPSVRNKWNDNLVNAEDTPEELVFDYNAKEAVNTRPVGGLTLEVAMFFDETAYKMFAPFMDYDYNRLQDMLLAYLNGELWQCHFFFSPVVTDELLSVMKSLKNGGGTGREMISAGIIKSIFPLVAEHLSNLNYKSGSSGWFPSILDLAKVQALYHQPSLGTPLEITLVRLDIMKKQPSKMKHHNGERSKLLDSFCDYQKSLNPGLDSDPDHWDMALYISGLDFYAMENGKKSGATMGLATVGGVCHQQYACIIAELGTTNAFGKPYPSAGFTSVYILAHEIGHNLGMHHDSMGNNCAKEGYIMSPSRGTNGETQWSSCSAKVMSKLSWANCLRDGGKYSKQLDHKKFLDHPGQTYTAKQQCEILLRDKDAVVSPNQDLSTICYNLQCKTPNRSGYYFAGPALDGTNCGTKKICFGGECLSKSLPIPTQVVPGGWSAWKEGICKSACIEKSKGYTSKRRTCTNPKPVNTDLGCEGSSVEYATCKDEKICKKRISAIEYASRKCTEFSMVLPELDSDGGGLQAPHEEGRIWMGCAIFCKRSDSGTFYTPRIELNDLGISPYFPDGTRCHTENNQNYYCMHHHCLPENFVFTKSSSSLILGLGDDVPFSQNAHPDEVVSPEVKSYLSLDSKGNPLVTSLGSIKSKSKDWETNDYIEIPELTHKRKRLFSDNSE